MISIKNLRNEKPTKPWQVRIDRSSPLGNPFNMSNESQRDDVCDKYDTFFFNIVNTSYYLRSNKQELIIQEICRLHQIYKEHGRLELFCWCSPRRCHAETVKRYLEKIRKERP